MTDRFVVRAVVIGLFVLGLLFGGGIVYLSATGHDHGVLDNLVSTVVGALAAVLASTRSSDEPQPVRIADEPVEVVTKDKGHGDLQTIAALCVIAIVGILVYLLVR